MSEESKKIQLLQCDFVQTKKMDFVDQPMVTSGKMAMKTPDFLSWKYTKPYEYAILFDKNKIYINHQGKKTSAGIKNKVFEKINNIIMGSTKGDLFLDKDFSVLYYKNGTTTVVHAVPKNAQLSKYIKEVELYFLPGKFVVNKIKMLEVSGDTTMIQFKNIKINGEVSASAFSF